MVSLLRFKVFAIICIFALKAGAQVPFNLTPDWISQPNGQIATGLGLADIDGDGFKDLEIANGNDIQRQRLAVHYNNGSGGFNLNPDWQSDDIDYHGHLVCGDLDNDGDLDAAVSVYIGPSGFSAPGELKVYYNQGGELEANPSFVSDPFYTFSCALGDADADGDLDIAAVAGEPYGGILDYGKIFINNNGTFQADAEWKSEVLMGALDVEFGDFNMDGFLDVIFVCEGTPNMIYLANEDGVIDETPDWQSSEPVNYINSVDVGYENSACYVVMTENDQLGGEGRVRRYDFGESIPATGSAGWYSNPFGYGSGITVFDIDLSGTQDLIYGGWWLPVKVALGLGNGEGYELNTTYTSSTSSVVETIQLADLDKVDIDELMFSFTVEGDLIGKNVAVSGLDCSMEGVKSITVNGQPLGPQDFKSVPGKPWVIFSDRFVEGDYISVEYYYSAFPDMVVTNWDSNKGDYIFYNTESSVGIGGQEGMEAGKQGVVQVWPVPAKDQVRIRFQPGSDISGSLRIEVCDMTGNKVSAYPFDGATGEMELNVGSLPGGLYLIRIYAGDSWLSSARFIKI